MKDLNNFEKENKIFLDNFKEWIYFRIRYYYFFYKSNFNQLDKSVFTKNNKKKNPRFILILKKIFFLFKTIFYGFNNWFHKYEYIIVSDSGQRKLINKKYYNKLFKEVVEYIGIDKTLMIEIPLNKHYRIRQIDTKHIVSFNLIKLIAKVLGFITKFFNKYNLFNQNSKIKLFFNANFPKKLINEMLNNFDYQKNTEKIFDIIFSINKIKILFLSCYYGKEGIIKSAKKRGIKVVELQHGLIGRNHFAYNSIIKLDNLIIPDVLLSFGEEGGYEEFVIKKIIPIGSFYIEYINKNYNISSDFINFKKKYMYIFSVSLQITCESELINFIKSIAKRYRDYLFIIIPRNYTNNYENLELDSNIIFYQDLDFYKITKQCDFHITIYSTTALESPSLGVPNILYNYNNLAYHHFNYLVLLGHSFIINDLDDFENALTKLKNLNRIEVINRNNSIIKKGYKENLKNALFDLIK